MAEPKTAHETELLETIKKGFINETEALLNLNLIKFNGRRYFDYRLIVEALENNQIDIVKLLVEKGFRVHKKSKSNQEKTVLHAAVQSKNAEIVKNLLAKGASLDILSSDEQYKTPVHLAVDEHQLSIVALFLSQLDVKMFDEKCILHYAIEKGDITVVRYLIASELSLKKRNEKNCTPFCIALKNKSLKILDLLLSHCSVNNINVNNFDDVAPVYIASMLGNSTFIKKYTDSGLPVSIPLKLKTQTWPCLRNYPGFTLLHFAVKYVQLELVEFLLSAGANVMTQDGSGSSPLHIAFESKQTGIWKSWKDFDNNNSVIDLLLKASMKIRSNPLSKHGISHFHIACSIDEPAIAEHFLKLGACVNQTVKPQCLLHKRFSPLHFAAKFRCSKTMELLLKNGADVKQRDFEKMTALHVAAKESCLDTVNLLLQNGADMTSVDSHGKTPVHWAFESQNYELVDLLLSVPNTAYSNPINSEGLSHFHIACTRNNVNVVKSFIEKGVHVDTCVLTKSDVAIDGNTDCSGYSPLHFAVTHNRAKIVQLLLRKEAKVDIKDNRGFTPLHMACNYSYEMFGEFIKNTLDDLKKRGKIAFQFRPLTDVAKVSENNSHEFSGSIEKINWSSNRRKHMKIIDSLLNSGSDINCTDNKGNTPVFYAYVAATKIERIMLNDLKCLETLWAQIVKDLSQELYERRKLILNNLMKLDVNLDKCYNNGSILHHIPFSFANEADEMMKLFLEKGADVDAIDETMRTPLHKAILSGEIKIVKLLLDYGADVKCIDPADNFTPLLLATSPLGPRFRRDVVEILVDKGANVNARQLDGRTALHNLVSRKDDQHFASLVPILIKAGADIDCRDSKGRTPLHLAVKEKKFHALEVLLTHGADIKVIDNKTRCVGLYLYEKYITNAREENNFVLVSRNVGKMLDIFQDYVVKAIVIGLPIKSAASRPKYVEWLNTKPNMKRFLEKLQDEMQKLRDAKIHANCTLYDAIFKKENALSQLVGNPRFKAVVQSKSFDDSYPHYGYLVRLKYQAGVDRAKLLPEAKCILNNLVRLHLPDTCSENIFKYFTNIELRQSLEILRGMLNWKVESTDEMQLRSRTAHKRQKVN